MLPIDIGVDIEEISRFSCKKYENNRNFYAKIFTPKEIKYCLNKSNPYPHFTVRFCAKEAVLKAFKNNKFAFTDIEIKMKNKKPILSLPLGQKALISMSHTNKYAIAFVILFKK